MCSIQTSLTGAQISHEAGARPTVRTAEGGQVLEGFEGLALVLVVYSAVRGQLVAASFEGGMQVESYCRKAVGWRMCAGWTGPWKRAVAWQRAAVIQLGDRGAIPAGRKSGDESGCLLGSVGPHRPPPVYLHVE